MTNADDYLFDPSVEPDASIEALEGRLRPFTDATPPLKALPPRTAVPGAETQPPMTMPPAIPTFSSNPPSSRRGLVLGAVAVAAAVTLAGLWALMPATQPTAPPETSLVAIDSARPPGSEITLVPPNRAEFDLSTLAVLPKDLAASIVFMPEDVRLGKANVDIAPSVFFAIAASAKEEPGAHYISKSRQTKGALKFAVDLEPGSYMACGMLTDDGEDRYGGCAAIDVAEDGSLSSNFIRLEVVEPIPPGRVSPDLKDPFETADDDGDAEAREDRTQRRQGAKKRKKGNSPDLKDPFRKKPTNGSSMGPEVLDPWADDERSGGVDSSKLKDPYAR